MQQALENQQNKDKERKKIRKDIDDSVVDKSNVPATQQSPNLQDLAKTPTPVVV